MKQKTELILSGAGFKKLLEKEYLNIQRKYDLLKIDLQIVTFLHFYGEKNTSKDIVELGCFTKGHVSQSITRLREKGVIKTVKDEKDRRYLHIYFGDNSEELIEDIKAVESKITGIVFNGFSDEEMNTFEKISIKIAENIADVI